MEILAERGIDEEFLTRILKKKLQVNDEKHLLRIEAISLGNDCGGDGYLSDVVPLKLQWNEPEEACKRALPTTVVAKIPHVEKVALSSQEEADAMNAWLPIAHDTECAFYKHFGNRGLPHLPTFYYSRPMSDPLGGLIVMQALSGAHVRFGKGFNVQQVKSIIDALASIQACSLQFDAWRGDIKYNEEALAGIMFALSREVLLSQEFSVYE